MEHIFTEANFEQEVLNSDIPVMVDFYADWCGPCQMMMPTVEALAEEFEGRVKIGKINSDDAQSLCQKYGVMSIPNFIFFKNGEKVDNAIGAQTEDALAEKLEALL
ncbi:thioredoxin [Lachnospiraceae bacterium A10]|jgi:thioredoxin 1|nr:thioredoxin [Lachnospiraceae bacterium A10]